MPTHADFLRSIVESPEDDGPRLLFADWLEEQGEGDRAEFIRVQCELARRPEAGARLVQLALRERELLARHEHTWLGPLLPHCIARFERGMMPQLIFGTAEFLRPKTQRTAVEWFPRVGVLGVSLSNKAKALGDLFDCPLLADLCSLELDRAGLGDDGMRRLLDGDACQNLRSLTRQLSFDRYGIEPGSIPSLLNGARRPRLRELSLEVEGPTAEAAREILDSGAYPGLIRLRLSGKAPTAREQVKVQGQYPQVLLEFKE